MFYLFQVTKISDVVSVGQKLNVMCIGLDTRGNINLSLKATLPKTASKATSKEGDSALSVQQILEESKPDKLVGKKQENKDKKAKKDVDNLSSIVILTAAECDDADDKSSTPKRRTKGKSYIPI